MSGVCRQGARSGRRMVVLRPEDARFGRGLAAAAVVGWSLIVGSLWVPLFGPNTTGIGIYFVLALFALPLSLLFCFSVGLIAWMGAVRRRWVRRRDAAGIGAVVGIVLALLWMAFMFHPTSPACVGAARCSLDELLPVGLGAAGYLAPVGAIAGLAAWWAGGRKSTLDETRRDDERTSQ